MNILIVEDNAQKAASIEEFLRNLLSDREHKADIALATCLADAVRIVASATFELIILDLMLPYLRDGSAESQAGVEMLRQIRHDECSSSSAAVIALSAFPDEVREFRERFERAGVLIVAYDEKEAWKSTLEQTVVHALCRSAGKQKLDFLIITALEEERGGYDYTDVEWISESIISGLNVRILDLPTEGRKFRGAIIKLRQMGLAAAILDASLALGAFDTEIICMSGICAGFVSQTKLGQLVIASPAWEYQAGKWSDNAFEIAPAQIPLRSATRVILDQIIDSAAFHDAIDEGLDRKIERPGRWTQPILAPAATGSAVIADKTRLEHIEQQHRKVSALDMETFGIYYTAHEIDAGIKHYFSVKCVVDLADADKDDDLHEYGCAASARASLFIIRRLLNGVPVTS